MNNDRKKLIRNRFHSAEWQEPIIFELGSEGERGYYPPALEEGIASEVGDVMNAVPASMRRKTPPALPEASEYHIMRHYLRLSQETMGMDFTSDISEGTCTMKYSPKLHGQLLANPKFAELHPLQDESTVQGILEIMWQFGEYARNISGMDQITFQPGGGAHGIFTNACLIRAYHESRGELEQRDEIITTMFSHPADAATPATAGFKLVTLYPDESGYPDLEALKAAVGPRTAGLMITNPEDTGLYNPRMREYVQTVHDVGGICSYDQANLNGIMGIARAKEAGFDTVHYNLHKTFSSPHGCMGPGCGAVMCKDFLAPFLPVPVIVNDGGKFRLDYDRPQSLGKIRAFYGNPEVVLRSYAWTIANGAEGLVLAAQTAVLNNNYFESMAKKIRGLSIPYAPGKRRLDQIRYSWEPMAKEIGIGTEDVNRRIVDFGIESYWMSHHPWVVPEPMTLEPCETYSKDDIDEYVAVLEQISDEAYNNPEIVKTAPHRSSTGPMDESILEDWDKTATTWRSWKKKKGNFSLYGIK